MNTFDALDRTFDVYKRTLRRPLVLGIMIVYTCGAAAWFTYRTVTDSLAEKRRQTEVRILQLESELLREREISARLAKIPQNAAFIRDLDLTDLTTTEPQKQNLKRLMDYVRFALSKSDYTYAKELLKQNPDLVDTPQVLYMLGKIEYLRGDSKAAIDAWARIQARAKTYPNDLNFYLAILYYQEGQTDLVTKSIKAYISRN